MTVKKRRTDPDLSVRIPEDNYEDLQKIAKAVGIPLARLVVDLTFEIFGLLGIRNQSPNEETPAEASLFVAPVLIRNIRANPKLRELAQKIRKRDRRSLPMDKTLPTRIRFTKEERVHLAQVSTQLHWAQSYVIWEAVYASVELATFERPLKDVPDIIKLYQGKALYEGTAQMDGLKTLTALFDVTKKDALVDPITLHGLTTSLNLVGPSDDEPEK